MLSYYSHNKFLVPIPTEQLGRRDERLCSMQSTFILPWGMQKQLQH